MAANPHVGDVGFVVRATVLDDADVAIPLVGPVTLRFRKPDGAIVDQDATLVGGGSGGQAIYTTVADDLDQAGAWKVQLKDADGPWSAEVVQFYVDPNLPEPGSP